jgi:hypothetical protein
LFIAGIIAVIEMAFAAANSELPANPRYPDNGITWAMPKK